MNTEDQQADKRGRVRRNAEQRQELIEAYQASGLSQAAFARQAGIHQTTLNQWLLRKARAGRPPAKRRKTCPPRYAKRCGRDGAFAQVDVTCPERVEVVALSGPAPVEIELRSGLRIRLHDARRIHDMVAFLREVGAC